MLDWYIVKVLDNKSGCKSLDCYLDSLGFKFRCGVLLVASLRKVSHETIPSMSVILRCTLVLGHGILISLAWECWYSAMYGGICSF